MHLTRERRWNLTRLQHEHNYHASSKAAVSHALQVHVVYDQAGAGAVQFGSAAHEHWANIGVSCSRCATLLSVAPPPLLPATRACHSQSPPSPLACSAAAVDFRPALLDRHDEAPWISQSYCNSLEAAALLHRLPIVTMFCRLGLCSRRLGAASFAGGHVTSAPRHPCAAAVVAASPEAWLPRHAAGRKNISVADCLLSKLGVLRRSVVALVATVKLPRCILASTVLLPRCILPLL